MGPRAAALPSLRRPMIPLFPCPPLPLAPSPGPSLPLLRALLLAATLLLLGQTGALAQKLLPPGRARGTAAPAPVLLLFLGHVGGAWAQRLYFFGDSLFDAGNAQRLPPPPPGTPRRHTPLADFPPYGQSLQPPRPTGRFSDGMVFPDFLAEKLGVPWAPPYLDPTADTAHGANFAVAGAGALNTSQLTSANLFEQLEWFDQHLKSSAVDKEELESSSLAALSIGGDDFFDFFLSALPFDYKDVGRAAAVRVVNATTAFIQRLYSAGVRSFLVLNVGPVGCVPLVRAVAFWSVSSCYEDANTVAQYHNQLLRDALPALQDALPGAAIALVDVYSAFYRVGDAHGIDLTEAACCGAPWPTNGLVQCGKQLGLLTAKACSDPTRKLFWDNIHPTQFASGQIFQWAWTGKHGLVVPLTLKALASRLAAGTASKGPGASGGPAAGPSQEILHSPSPEGALDPWPQDPSGGGGGVGRFGAPSPVEASANLGHEGPTGSIAPSVWDSPAPALGSGGPLGSTGGAPSSAMAGTGAGKGASGVCNPSFGSRRRCRCPPPRRCVRSASCGHRYVCR